MDCVGVCSLKLCQGVLLVFAFHVLLNGLQARPCFALQDLAEPTVSSERDSTPWISGGDGFFDAAGFYHQPTFFYDHNESRVALAMAEADDDGGGGARERSSSTISDWNSNSLDGCLIEAARMDLTLYDSLPWTSHNYSDSVSVQLFAVDSCADDNMIFTDHGSFKISSQPWRTRIRQTLKRRNYVKVLVRIRASGMSIIGEGVYVPATRKMHLVGCTRHVTRVEAAAGNTSRGEQSVPFSDFEADSDFRSWGNYGERWELLTTSGACAMAVTLQYPPLKSRWNWQRVMKLSLRSTRDVGDALHFDPVERSVFRPPLRHGNSFEYYLLHERFATGIRIVILLVGLVFVALQIRHGKNNEEALPFASLAMLGIQIAHHVSQTSLFKDLQIGQYERGLDFVRRYSDGPSPGHMPFEGGPSMGYIVDGESSFLGNTEFAYYATMAWHEWVPYQALAMAAIFMYVWIFHSVGDRRRIMQSRVRKGRLGAVNPPRDGQIVFATFTLFAIVGVVAVLANVVDRSGAVGEPGGLLGNSNITTILWGGEDQFVSPKFYELWDANWGVLNRVTGLVVSLFLVPQLLGNWRWEVQGRPLSRWFYLGLPVLQSLLPLFAIAKHFQLLPIFEAYDPYLDSFYGMYRNPTPWWQMAAVSCSGLLAIAVHLQFSSSFRPSHWQASLLPRTPRSQPDDML